MGGIVGKPKDIWLIIYERSITDAHKIQKHALKLTIEGKLSGLSSPLPPPNPSSSHNSANSSSSSHGGEKTAGGGIGGGSGGGSNPLLPWSFGPNQTLTHGASEKFHAITQYVDHEWTEKDRKELKSYAQKLWKQYRKSKEPHMTSAEFLCLTKDSLQTLQSHISLFINNAYEEMKKHTQICMINLLQRYRLANIGGGGLSSASALRDSSYNHSGSSLGTPTINVNDIDWLNEQVETEKKNLMQALNTQIEEWIEHAQDVAEALQNRIDPSRSGVLTQKQFVENFGPSIYEVVGPHFFSQYLPTQHAAEE